MKKTDNSGAQFTGLQHLLNECGKNYPAIRYTDRELEDFSRQLTRQIEEDTADLNLLTGALARHPNRSGDVTFKLTDDASEILSKEQIAEMALERKTKIEQLRQALVRIENKTYGICMITGKLIAKDILKKVPHATVSTNIKPVIKQLN
jgi:RNA polymerase-binding transcription factor DksA